METRDIAEFYQKLEIDRNNPKDYLLKKMNDWPEFQSFCCTKTEVEKLVNPQQINNTLHSKYSNYSLIEAFEESNQSGRCRKFLDNPIYFSKYLKSTPKERVELNGDGLGSNTIELSEYKGKFSICDGNHRVLFAKVARLPLVYATVTVFTPDPRRTDLFKKAKAMGIILDDYREDPYSCAAYLAEELGYNPHCEPYRTFENLENIETSLLEIQKELSQIQTNELHESKFRRTFNKIFFR
ncbi:hypothetical protein ABFY54_30105 [Priestia megaterium]|uniref:hypothetical protein n=1 Tax=Priestia TaxID=2800373 RepID=UPI001CFB9A92|nr:hypothetical protein [Priestia aryabhattai]